MLTCYAIKLCDETLRVYSLAVYLLIDKLSLTLCVQLYLSKNLYFTFFVVLLILVSKSSEVAFKQSCIS